MGRVEVCTPTSPVEPVKQGRGVHRKEAGVWGRSGPGHVLSGRCDPREVRQWTGSINLGVTVDYIRLFVHPLARPSEAYCDCISFPPSSCLALRL